MNAPTHVTVTHPEVQPQSATMGSCLCESSMEFRNLSN
jgi:hypothetical protein